MSATPKSSLKILMLCSLALIFSTCRVGTGLARSRLDRAEELLRQEKYDQAIEIYQQHMKDRLSLKERPEWENPYFYYLLIGDIELRRSNVDGALAAYKTAQENGIHVSLISDRIRYVAGWYEQQNQLEKAIGILQAQRALDPLLFDAMLDRLSKEIIRQKDAEPSGTTTDLAGADEKAQ